MDKQFEEMFFDVRTHKPKPGQIVACYNSIVELLDCPFKDVVINTLQTHDGAGRAIAILAQTGKATSLTAYNLCKQMITDLLETDVKTVRKKPYKYMVQLFFYTSPENLPKDDPHWSVVCEVDDLKNMEGMPI